MLACLRKTHVMAVCLGCVAWAVFALAGTAQAQQEQAQQDQAQSPAYSTLADMLENEQTRNTLIQELRRMAAQEGTSASASTAAAKQPEKLSLPRRLADTVSEFAGEVGARLTTIVANLRGIFTAATGTEAGFDLRTLGQGALNLGLVVLAVVGAFFLFRLLAHPLFSRLSHWSRHGGDKSALLRLLGVVLLATAVDILVVALAYVTGNILATFAIGETGALNTHVALFLNAFLLIELLKAGIRMLFSSRYEGLRLLPIATGDAVYWNRFLAR
ncbi:MAG: mechanosensitive ion channel protein MscS, partial [Thermodesulfobacteriota bacterium]